MSFALPTTITIVDKYVPQKPDPNMVVDVPKPRYRVPPNLWQIVSKYDSFSELVRVAQMENILKDPQAKLTLFIPTDLTLPRTTLKACIGNQIQEKDTLAINFELARVMVNSLIIPSVLSTTMMIQSAFTRYRTRDAVNTLLVQTPHCVQFEPETYNKPPFGIVLNGKTHILTPDVLASNGMVHVVDSFPFW